MKLKFIFFLLFIITNLYSYSDLFKLDLEDLSSIELKSTSATLTRTDVKKVPATITIITHKDIEDSGARNLDELLEIYVPSFTYMHKVHASQIGFRGILRDRNNKVLLLVNNRVMNIKTTDGGAISERWFSTLGDIESIKVITGPGSAIYGSGAIAGVISIETFSGKTKDGINIDTKAGLGEKFSNVEMSYGETIEDDLHMYIYYGISKDIGADSSDAPMKFAFNYKGKYYQENGDISLADKPFKYSTTNNYGSIDENLKHKLHLQIDSDNFTLWFRFTKTSLAEPTTQQLYYWINKYTSKKYKNTGNENQQITLFAQQKQRLKSNLDLTYQLSYLRSDVDIDFFDESKVNGGDKFWGEDNLMAKVLLNYDIDYKNQLAVGLEYNYNWLGRSSTLSSCAYSKTGVLDEHTKWNSDLISLYGEYQTSFVENLTMFIGGRVDNHKYAPILYSPRIDFIYNTNDRDIIKLGFNKSSRHSDEAVMYKSYNNDHKYDDIEEIETIELNYIKYLKQYTFNVSTFYNNYSLISWNNSRKITQNIGDVNSYGAEVEFNYKQGNIEFNIAHSYTKMYSFTLKDKSIEKQNVSASVYGYGNDFANWNNHITKIRFNYNINKKFRWTNSLRILWGMEGAKDMANYNKDLELPSDEQYILPYYDDGHTTAFGKSMYLNSAFLFNANRNMLITINAYNILGILDEDYNKRNFFQTTSQYRDAAPSISIGLKYKF